GRIIERSLSDDGILMGYPEPDISDDYLDSMCEDGLITEEQRDIMLRVGRILGNISSVESVENTPDELELLGKRYTESAERIALYREDDSAGAEEALEALRAMYKGLVPPLREQAIRLREADFYGNAALRDVLKLLLP
ncbi:MAG: hypothetical protein IKW19_00155, partial [Akkermansia sp.]|nr:hypothetical protein [Akkermansia sp.]